MGKLNNIRLILNSEEGDKPGDNTGDGSVAVAEQKPKLKEPPRYQVILINDDFTPMEFVVEILQTYFYMNREKATQIMLAVHTQGKGICGVYPRDIAETKMMQVNEHSKQAEHPLMCVIEKAD